MVITTQRPVAGIGLDMPRQSSSYGRWLSWLLGAGLLIAVIAAVLHGAEERAFARVAQEAEPWWLGAAVALQIGTYIAQGGIWRIVARAASCDVSRRTAVALSLAKVFADQAFPSAGLSSSLLIAKALDQRSMPSAAVKASVLIERGDSGHRRPPPRPDRTPGSPLAGRAENAGVPDRRRDAVGAQRARPRFGHRHAGRHRAAGCGDGLDPHPVVGRVRTRGGGLRELHCLLVERRRPDSRR